MDGPLSLGNSDVRIAVDGDDRGRELRASVDNTAGFSWSATRPTPSNGRFKGRSVKR